MASGSTSRLAIPYPVGTDPTNVPGDVQALATRLDGITFEYTAGVAAARPSPSTPGKMYYATDTQAFSFDTGTAWLDFGNSVPIGTILNWPGLETTIPSNYLNCDGSSYSTTTYNALYLALGGAASVWGTGSGTFNVPDMRAVVAVGVTNTPRVGRANYTLGSITGSESNTIALNQMPLHSHGINDEPVLKLGSGTFGLAAAPSAQVTNQLTGITEQAAGGSTPLSVVQPSVGTNVIIRAL